MSKLIISSILYCLCFIMIYAYGLQINTLQKHKMQKDFLYNKLHMYISHKLRPDKSDAISRKIQWKNCSGHSYTRIINYLSYLLWWQQNQQYHFMFLISYRFFNNNVILIVLFYTSLIDINFSFETKSVSNMHVQMHKSLTVSIFHPCR